MTEAERLATRITSSIALYPEYNTAAEAAALLRTLQVENEALKARVEHDFKRWQETIANYDFERSLNEKLMDGSAKLTASNEALRVNMMDAFKTNSEQREKLEALLEELADVNKEAVSWKNAWDKEAEANEALRVCNDKQEEETKRLANLLFIARQERDAATQAYQSCSREKKAIFDKLERGETINLQRCYPAAIKPGEPHE